MKEYVIFSQQIESLLGVPLSGDTVESDDILLCRLMNKLHPGTIHTIHEEVYIELCLKTIP